MSFPFKINFKYDDCEAVLISETMDKSKGEKIGRYRYLTGFYFQGKELDISEKYLNKLLRSESIKEIK